MEKYKIALIGLKHMHASALFNSFSKLGDKFEWIGCTDTLPCVGSDESRMDAVLPKGHGLKYFETPESLLDKNPDLVLVCSDNASHGSLCEIILERRIPVVLEKPMAVSLSDGMRMARASALYNTPVFINWPVTWMAGFRLAWELTKKGAVGNPVRFHYRNPFSLGPFSHGKNPPAPDEAVKTWWYKTEMGGGAMLDYCGYGCLLATWFFGKRALSAFGYRANLLSPWSPVEDYSTMTVAFPGAVALLEGSWANPSTGGVPTGPVVFGDNGMLTADRYNNDVRIYKPHSSEPDEIVAATPITSDLADSIYALLTEGTTPHETLCLPLNINALAALDAGLRSAKSGNIETVTLPQFCFSV